MDALRRVAREAARKMGLQEVADACGAGACAGLATACLLVLAERLLAPGLAAGVLVAAPVAVGLLAGLSIGAARWPCLEAAALAVDRRFALAERLSSALTAGEGAMAELVRADARRHVAPIDLAVRMPLRPPRLWVALVLCGVGASMALLVPQMDVLGWRARRESEAGRRERVARAAQAAAASLVRLAGVGRENGLERSAAVLERAAKEIASTASAGQTARAAEKVGAALTKAMDANSEALRLAGAEEREKLLRERDMQLGAASVVRRWRERVGARGGGDPTERGKGSEVAKDGGHEAAEPSQFVLSQGTPERPAGAAALEERLVAAGPAADAALARRDIPWRYREVVRRYFSPDESNVR